MLILHGVQPLHWAVAGALIGLITLGLLFVSNRSLGISTGFENLCALGSRLPFFQKPDLKGAGNWRLPFLVGLVLAGVLSSNLSGTWDPLWALGMFDTFIGSSHAAKIAWMFVGGLFIGFGTRLAGGCTSGHGIFGISNFEIGSIVSTVSFMAAGAVVTNLIYRLLLGA
ncbi:MAG: YeeE/YedE family protein [Nitrospirae bacterium]|nr:YeeE/YedE family protein [Nitrospirota bacterium]